MNNPFELPATGKSADWLIFVAMLLAIGLPIAGFVIWLTVYRNKTKKARRKRRQRHSRQHNPTLAETGGLPPKRDPNQPPAGL
jgi:heme/copper-type cytochrome/quinol oxidase subunit 2